MRHLRNILVLNTYLLDCLSLHKCNCFTLLTNNLFAGHLENFYCCRYGSVKSVRCLPEKYCAFVNFLTKEAAGKAMVNLQVILLYYYYYIYIII